MLLISAFTVPPYLFTLAQTRFSVRPCLIGIGIIPYRRLWLRFRFRSGFSRARTRSTRHAATRGRYVDPIETNSWADRYR